jgi:transposase
LKANYHGYNRWVVLASLIPWGEFEKEGKTLILSVTKKTKSAVCPQCGKKSEHLHQNQNYLIKDLPMGDKEVILNINRRRFKCKKCRKTFN